MLAGDEAYVRPMGVAVSTVTRSAPGERFRFLVCGNRLDDPSVSFLRRAAAPNFLDVAALPESWTRDLPVDPFPAEMFARLFVDKLVPATTRRVLYLDADVLVRRSVAPLFEIDLRDCVIAASPIGERPVTAESGWPRTRKQDVADVLRSHGAPAAALQFNSGVMVIDVDRWAEMEIPKAVAGLAARLAYGDQTYLNAILWDKWLPLSKAWNGKESDGFILHFAGRRKPWNPDYYDNEFAREYENAAARIGWDLRPSHRVRVRRTLKRILRNILPPAAAHRLRSRSTPPSGPRWRD